eukprot:923901-Rhodomonas_salina.1
MASTNSELLKDPNEMPVPFRNTKTGPVAWNLPGPVASWSYIKRVRIAQDETCYPYSLKPVEDVSKIFHQGSDE